jgi:hypothetical protein
MLEEDDKRIERERDIVRAVAPVNYTRLENEISAAKAESSRRIQSAQDHHARERAGYYRGYCGNLLPDGSIPPFPN